jgi:hypothetical protein
MQTSYTKIPGQSFQGMLSDSTGVRDIVSAAYAALAAGSAEFGLAMVNVAGHDNQAEPQSNSVTQAIKNRQVALPTDVIANQPLLGVGVSRFIAPGSAAEHAFTGEQGIADTHTVDVLRKGRIWVPTETAVDPTQPVYYRYSANGGNTKLGYWSKTSDVGHNSQVPNGAAVWVSTTTGAGLAELEINLP